MTACKGRLFGPGLAATGVDVDVALLANTLTFSGLQGLPLQVIVSQIAARYTGFNDSQFELAWRNSSGAWACHVSERAAIDALLAAWPPDAATALQGVRHQRTRRALPWAALALFISLPVLLLASFLIAQSRVVDFIAGRISPSFERQLGAAAMVEIKAGTQIIDAGPQWQALTAVAAQVVGADHTRYRFHLAADEAINAFALPGGDIVVNRGLLSATHDAGELAGVLAHEIQHVALRHSLKGMLRTAGLSLLWSALLGDPSATLAGQAADRLLSLKFSRDAERQADEAGFTLLVERGIDPRGMVAFFGTLAKQGGATPPALLSTHPASEDREKQLAARLARLPANCCQPLLVAGAWPPK